MCQYPGWQTLLLDALAEIDSRALQLKVRKAETAISARFKVLSSRGYDADEAKALREAIGILKRLRKAEGLETE